MIFDDFQGMLLLYSILTYGALAYCLYINTTKKYYWMAMFGVVAFGFLGYSMNGMRQALSIAIGCNIIQYVLSKKIIKAILLLSIAALFHRSILLMLPFVMFISLVYEKIYNSTIKIVYLNMLSSVLMIIVFFVLFNFFSQHLDMIEGFYGGYFSGKFSGAVGFSKRLTCLIAFNFILVMIAGSYKIEGTQRVKIFMYSLFLITACAAMIAQMNAMRIFYRVVDIFNIYICLIIPEIMVMEQRAWVRAVFTVMIIVIGVLVLSYLLISGVNEVADYTFFW